MLVRRLEEDEGEQEVQDDATESQKDAAQLVRTRMERCSSSGGGSSRRKTRAAGG